VNNFAIILAGGVGSRFWPLSRRSLPKQFLKILKSKESLLGSTIKRAKQIVPRNNIYIVTNKLYLNQVKNETKDFNLPDKNIVLEPEAKNTLPAILLCVQIIRGIDISANLLILPSDHYIKNKLNFKRTISMAFNLSQKGFICLIGIKPNQPCLGYGYILTEKKKNRDIFFVRNFIEKPTIDEARILFKKKNVYWNSGIFCFKAETILSQTKIHQPGLYKQILKIRNKNGVNRIFKKLKSISIDYGILEKSKNLIMIEGKFFWSDLGSWDSLYEILPKDRDKNILLSDSDCIRLDSSNTLVCSYNPRHLIAGIGLKNLIIVDTSDALLVCKKDRAQDIKNLVRLLRKRRKRCV
jgi:mannose-1-phosphate guanylyltransferase